MTRGVPSSCAASGRGDQVGQLRLRWFEDFESPELATLWNKLLGEVRTSVFATREWQTAWWQAFGRGVLHLFAVEHSGQVLAICPFFSDGGMVYFVGSGGSDYLDFMGDVSEPEVLELILTTTRSRTPGFLGFCFYHVPDHSNSAVLLRNVAERLGWDCVLEGGMAAPAMDLSGWSAADGKGPADKKSLVRHERALRRDGTLDVMHCRTAEEVEPQLDVFFEQHIRRWAATPHPSLFLDPQQRQFYRYLVRCGSDAGWLRFTRINWNGQPAAFHLGACFQGSYLWYKPTFDVTLARRSPGEVLLRQLILAAQAEGAHTFDFGLGEEAFKDRFATHRRRVSNWALYPRTGAA